MNTMLEHDYEPEPGLPQALPRGERVLWQGKPDADSLARRTFHVRKLAAYFVVLLALRTTLQLNDGVGLGTALSGSMGLSVLAAVAVGMLVLYSRLVARSTLYTITNRRVVIRCGIAVPLTMNLPFSRIEAADLRRHGEGSGDIAIVPEATSRVSYVLLWPLVKPWRFLRVRPVLRGVVDAERVAGLLVDALETCDEAMRNKARAATAATPPSKPADAPASGPGRRRWGAYPTVPLAAAASLVVLSLVGVGWMRISGVGDEVREQEQVVTEIDLYFEDREDGSVVVVSADSGETIDVLEPGSNGFLRGALRSVVRGRRAVDAGSDIPFSLRLVDGGMLLLHDPATGRDVDLLAFGRTNAEAFSRFLPQHRNQPLATNTIPLQDVADVTAVASNNQEAKP